METLKAYRRSIIVIATPILLSPLLPLYGKIGITPRVCNCLYMLLLMAVYWCTEVVPLAVTALLPLTMAPLMGILEADVVCKNYFKDKIALFFVTMVLATAIQHTGLHRRIALTFIKLFGTNPRLLMLGFMVPTWFLSMWISNSSTAVMMVSILNCVIDKLREQEQSCNIEDTSGATGDECETSMTNPKVSEDVDVEISDPEVEKERKDSAAAKRFEGTAKCLCLAVCYGATCGGMATLTGTGTNLVFYDNVVEVGKRLSYDFGITLPNWIGFAMPISVLLLAICWAWLQVLFLGCRKSALQTKEDQKNIREVINKEYASLGKINWREGITLIHFVVLVVLWLGRYPAKAGGWGLLFPKGFVSDATTAMFVATLLLFMPRYPPLFLKRESSRPYQPLMSWQSVAEKLNWGVVFLIAGGFALADCVHKSGLAEVIGNNLQFITSFPVWAMTLVICIISAGVTEFTSNVVICSLIQLVLADIAVQGQLNPLILMVPSCLASSFAFMLPVATPPNAIVFSAGVLKISDMVKAGIFLNIIAIFLVLLATTTWGPLIFNYNSFSYDSVINVTLSAANFTS